MKFVVQFRSLFLLFLSLSVATADQMCKQRINFKSQDTVWQTHMHTSTHTYTHRDKQGRSHALPNIFVNKLLHTFRQLLQLHLDAVLRLPQHPFPFPCTCRYSFLTSLSPSFLPSTLNSICLCYANALTGFPNPKSICVALIVSLFPPLFRSLSHCVPNRWKIYWNLNFKIEIAASKCGSTSPCLTPSLTLFCFLFSASLCFGRIPKCVWPSPLSLPLWLAGISMHSHGAYKYIYKTVNPF